MKKISIYQVEDEPIGSGGMGRVYRGTDPQGRKVAIKEILPEFASDFEIRTRTEHEVELLQQLNNDSIVKVYDQFPLGGNFFIVMEFVDGLNVEQYVQQCGALFPDRAARFMVKILDAMQFVHEKNFVHRDMKPSNIMIREDERVCILDFGIAKDMGGPGNTTIFGTIIGSDGYMSPEQADGLSIDHRADIYALGCVFYYMLTGHHAYNTLSSDYETRTNIVKTPFPKLSKYSKRDFPSKLQEILDRATDKNMMKRYQSCREFRKDLEALYPSASDSNTHISQNKTEDIFITVGREGCDILVNDDLMKVSRRHLEITYRQFTGGRYYVISDHSANGTLVNGRRLGRGESVNIPADGAAPQVLLACDEKYLLDWEKVRHLIAGKLKEQTGPTDASGGTIVELFPHPLPSPRVELRNSSPIDAIRLFFTRAFDFNGRSRRREFWWVQLFLFLIYLSIGVFMILNSYPIEDIYLVSGIINLILLIPNLSLQVRRLHDQGKNWTWILLGLGTLIPFVNIFVAIYWIVLMATDSDPDGNQWGACPK